MSIDFRDAFRELTGNPPFPWQQALYERFITEDIPASCNLPTGLGKTAVIAIWLIALANHPEKMPRRLVYVVNRRTVVDQTTDEVEKYRAALQTPALALTRDLLAELCALPIPADDNKAGSPLALSTLRGQFADNREWAADPARPAVICGTVDMIGSRLLFSGYGLGFKSRPLHAGFLGQDALLVHDEAHLEPAFQKLVEAICEEQRRCNEFTSFRVMELTATSRGGGESFPNEKERKANEADVAVQKRIGAKKSIRLHAANDPKNHADQLAKLALGHAGSDKAVLIFVRKVEDVEKIIKKLPKDGVEQLTGTLRGLERDGLVRKPIFQRFLPASSRDNTIPLADGTVYLVCTSAGEVGVNISADHLVCDLSTFDSMAQRFGRVNRFGICADTRIDIVHPKVFDEKDDFESRLKKTLDLLEQLNDDGSPIALGHLDSDARIAAFAPPPTILPVTDFLFDAWALTTIKDKLPGRPIVEPYLHGISEWQPLETHIAWREEVEAISADLLDLYDPVELLEDYPLKPHELLRDNSNRVFDCLKKLNAAETTPVWMVAADATVDVTTIGKIIAAGKEYIERKTVLLPPTAGGLEMGRLCSDSTFANDVADDWFKDAARTRHRRCRVWWTDDDEFERKSAGMRLIRRIDIPGGDDDDDAETRSWHWFELPKDGDSDGSKASKLPVLWEVHVKDVFDNATSIARKLPLSHEIRDAIAFAARFHDHGKHRKRFQTVLGNFQYPEMVLAKSGRRGGPTGELYRHEFGSLLNVQLDQKFKNLDPEQQALVLHVIAVHHGYGRPHFPMELAFDPDPPSGSDSDAVAIAVPQRFARLQRKYGRWGLAYIESLLRAADYAASANPSEFMQEGK